MVKIAVTLTLSQAFLFATNGQNTIQNLHAPPIRFKVFTSHLDVSFAFDKSFSTAKLDTRDILVVDSIIRKVADSLNLFITSKNIESGKVDTLYHVFQIVSARNRRGEKVVWVNAVCEPPEDWKRRLVVVEDGGSCYYNFKINFKQKTYYRLYINSNA